MNKLCVVCTTVIYGQKQKYCSNACKQKDHYHRIKTQTNTYHSQTLRSLKRKLQLIDLHGGKCTNCGYNANAAALHFHHKLPGQKSFKLDMRVLSNKRWDLILEEASKCMLLCSNCHAEAHHPELTIHNIQQTIYGVACKKLQDEKGVNSGKPASALVRNGNPEPSQVNDQLCNLEGAETKK